MVKWWSFISILEKKMHKSNSRCDIPGKAIKFFDSTELNVIILLDHIVTVWNINALPISISKNFKPIIKHFIFKTNSYSAVKKKEKNCCACYSMCNLKSQTLGAINNETHSVIAIFTLMLTFLLLFMVNKFKWWLSYLLAFFHKKFMSEREQWIHLHKTHCM